jgi:tetratricopeptide (TPR) repeat protein
LGDVLKSIYQLFQRPLQLLIKELAQISSLERPGLGGQNYLSIEVEYCKGLVAYLSGDSHELLHIINKIKATIDCNDKNLQDSLVRILELRLLVREKNIPELQTIILKMESLDFLNKTMISENYLGEYHFVLAKSYELLSDYKKSIQNYTQAASFYHQLGLNKKYLKSLFNSMVHREYLSEKITLEEYHDLLKMAIRARDRSILGCILQNLSFQLLFAGSYNSALKLSKKSLRILQFEGESLNYQLAELNLAHIYYLMGYHTELAKLEVKFENSKYPEIRAGIKLIKTSNFNENKEFYSLGWTWRLHKKM